MAREQRKLAAILAVDVVGYSRLMSGDEAGTLARLRAVQAGPLKSVLDRHGEQSRCFERIAPKQSACIDFPP